MTGSFPYLTTLILVPAGAAVAVALVPKAQRRLVQLIGYVASPGGARDRLGGDRGLQRR